VNNADDDDYDHYNVEGSDPRLRGRGRAGRGDRDFDLGDSDNPLDDIGGAVLGAALGFAGRAIGRRMKKAFDERVVPAMEAKAAQAQQQFEQQRAEQDAIVARYPELRACTKDQVVFLDGGSRTVPVSDITMPVTLTQADAVVARLR
jgi:membrane protease subunit (stomatin/prohibitin family)